jgi:hypothetical protein
MKKKLFFLAVATTVSIISFDSVAQNRLNNLTNHQQHQNQQNQQNQQNFDTPETTRKMVSRTEEVQHLDSVYTYQYNASTDTWDIINRIIDIRYDAHDNIYHENEQRKTSMGFENSALREYTFEGIDDSTRIKTRLDRYWNGSLYQNKYLWTYIYDRYTNQFLVALTLQAAACCNNWVDVEQDLYYYDSNNKLSEDVFSLWHSDTGFQLNSKKAYAYNSSNQLKKLTYYTYNYQVNDWQSVQRSVYHYNENGNNDRELIQGGEDSGWAKQGKVKRFYDDDNKLTTENYFYWQDSNWVKNGVVNYNYNNQGSLKVVTWRNILNGEVNLGTRTRYFYHSGVERLVNGASEAISPVSAASSVIVYPNPSTGNFTVKFDNKPITNLEVYNSIGEKILEQRSGEVDLNNRSKGVYFIRVYDGQKIYQEKILVQ